MKLAPIADKLALKAAKLNLKPDSTRSVWDQLRDYCDGWTQMELDTLQLDMLTDMVVKRLDKATAQ